MPDISRLEQRPLWPFKWLGMVIVVIAIGIILPTYAATSEHAAAVHSVTLPALRAELVQMEKDDQAARGAWINSGRKPHSAQAVEMARIDKSNLSRVHAIARQHGFPDAGMVGLDGVEDFWVLAQHAMDDVPFMARMLTLARPLMLKGELPRRDYALLTDRVRLAQGKKQLYGSQASIKHGELVLAPLEDPAHVDQRRASMGMMPEADYLKMGRQHYHLATPAAPSNKKS